MRLFDTRRDALHEVVAGRTVRLYVCGITPYDAAHLGHAATYVTFDILQRTLERRGHVVRHVRNVTDVDDDILRVARERGVDYLALATEEVARFDRELGALGCRPPDSEPRATGSVPAIVQAVRGLVRLGHAYPCDDGRVYFEVGTAPGFGALSRLDRARMLSGFAGNGGDPDAPGKRDPLDFLLWQPSADGEPAWASDWGPGRPGWHIECSVMAMEELGNTIDIHGGGRDLVFPHHEAEIAQSEHLTGQRPFARFWVHTGMVGLDGVKMSKSLGNLVFVGDLLECYEADAVRRYLLEHHYRSDWDFDRAGIEAAGAATKAWRQAPDSGTDQRLEAAFDAALDDDLDTPAALEAIDAAARHGAGDTVRRLAGALGFPGWPG
jgi:L-cysteine:1D-myo-inositol 2-amino-2-deoxy-alpha-D-glucopyranoside ligase